MKKRKAPCKKKKKKKKTIREGRRKRKRKEKKRGRKKKKPQKHSLAAPKYTHKIHFTKYYKVHFTKCHTSSDSGGKNQPDVYASPCSLQDTPGTGLGATKGFSFILGGISQFKHQRGKIGWVGHKDFSQICPGPTS
jgi:hypothetical protein